MLAAELRARATLDSTSAAPVAADIIAPHSSDIIDNDQLNWRDALLLGQGAFGTVHRASWRKTPVAIKTGDAKISDFEKALFLRELDTLTRLRHPNIVQFLGFCNEPFCIALEYLPNSDLRTYSKKHRPGISHKLRIAIDIMRGLAYLHNRKPEVIIHRDIKPTNVLITASGVAKISDFGLARMTEHARHERSKNGGSAWVAGDPVLCVSPTDCAASPTRRRRSSGESDTSESRCLSGNVGTKRYMAPEANSTHYTCAVDIYSAGATLYELFEGDLFSGVLWAVAPASVRPPISRMCRSEPAERPTALETIDLLEELQDNRARGYIARFLHSTRPGSRPAAAPRSSSSPIVRRG